LTAEELFEVGDALLVLAGLSILLEEGMQTLEDARLPGGEELGFEVMLAAKVRLAGGAAQEFENDFGFELRGERTSLTTWHGKVSWLGPVFMLLVQRQGRTTIVAASGGCPVMRTNTPAVFS
jgi:hypothetical protein